MSYYRHWPSFGAAPSGYGPLAPAPVGDLAQLGDLIVLAKRSRG